jgi:hypothetical protein
MLESGFRIAANFRKELLVGAAALGGLALSSYSIRQVVPPEDVADVHEILSRCGQDMRARLGLGPP